MRFGKPQHWSDYFQKNEIINMQRKEFSFADKKINCLKIYIHAKCKYEYLTMSSLKYAE